MLRGAIPLGCCAPRLARLSPISQYLGRRSSCEGRGLRIREGAAVACRMTRLRYPKRQRFLTDRTPVAPRPFIGKASVVENFQFPFELSNLISRRGELHREGMQGEAGTSIDEASSTAWGEVQCPAARRCTNILLTCFWSLLAAIFHLVSRARPSARAASSSFLSSSTWERSLRSGTLSSALACRSSTRRSRPSAALSRALKASKSASSSVSRWRSICRVVHAVCTSAAPARCAARSAACSWFTRALSASTSTASTAGLAINDLALPRACPPQLELRAPPESCRELHGRLAGAARLSYLPRAIPSS
eukprot:scaffold70697_cov29-Tisochrysis_lutea.AAC.2